MCLSKRWNATGTLRQIEAILAPAKAVDQFDVHLDNGNIGATWAFACRYRLESLLKEVECKIEARPKYELVEYGKGLDQYALSLPALSSDLALCSLSRLLLGVTAKWAKV
jgi:hypothetical protein